MKTKFKSLLAVTLAATTFFSCSNEIETPDNAQMLNPGDVQISIGLGNGVTTYSTIEAEKAFKDGSGKLFAKDGSEIPMKEAAIKMEGGALKFSAIVEAGKFTEGSDASLYLYTNGTPNAAAGADEATFKKTTVSTVLDRILTKGLPAGFGPSNVTLKGGNIASGSAVLNRAASRVGAKFTGMHTDGYAVALNKVNTTSGALFEVPTVVADGTGSVPARTLDGQNLAAMYKGTETVAYVYPSSNKSEVVVTPPAGKGAPKTINFAPIAGKNYTINITPPKSSDASMAWDVSIAEWSADEEFDADFDGAAADVLILDALPLILNARVNGTNYILDAYAESQAGTDLLLTDLAIGESVVKSIENLTITGSSPYLNIAVVGKNLKVKAVPNTTGSSVKATVTVSGIQDDGKNTPYSGKFTIELPSIEKASLDAMKAATVKMGDVEFVMFGTSGNLKTDYAKAVELAGLGGFSESAITAATVSKYVGPMGARKTCPVGYKIPTLADYTDNLFGGSTRTVAGNDSGKLPKWGLKVGDQTLGATNDVKLTTLFLNPATAASAFKVERAGKTYYMAGSSGYWTTTSGTALTGGNAAHAVRVAPWHDGIAFNAAASDTADSSSTRCIVDNTYTGLK